MIQMAIELNGVGKKFRFFSLENISLQIRRAPSWA
jgi:hypothetical protein